MEDDFWYSKKPVKNIKEIFYLTGFEKFGSIRTIKNIDCFEKFNISFDFNILKSAQNNAAIIDVDFNINKKSKKNRKVYASVVCVKDNFLLFALDNNKREIILKENLKKGVWHNFNLSINLQKIVLIIDNLIVGEYEYKNNVENFQISIGNNNMIPNVENFISFKIKNVVTLISDKSYLLKSNNLKINIL
jgi:hypothetical protein